MKILNLYSGLGGNRRLWEGHDVTAVENNTKVARVYCENFPSDKIILGDAHQYLLDHFEEFDFIWSSPPCQSHSRMVKATRHKIRKYPDMKLYEEIIFLQNFFRGYWVVENVVPYYGFLIEPTVIINRHPIWSNFMISPISIKSPKNFIKGDKPEEIKSLKERYGISYDGNIYLDGNHSPGQALRNCVDPQLGLHILSCLEQPTPEA